LIPSLQDLYPSFLLKPGDEFFDAGFDGGPWMIAEQAAGLFDTRVGDGNIAGLRRLMINNRRLAQSLFEQLDEPAQLDRRRLAEVDDLVAARVVAQRRNDAGDDVVYV